MAWTEQTIFNVRDPDEDEDDRSAATEDEEERIRKMFQNMPPFIKISSRRARRALVKYEAFKQRYVENLRNNPVYKFVMQVAAFTNEDMSKYWRGKTLAPFMESYAPQNIKIEKEDVELLIERAREHAFADLHQFCRPIDAVPVYRRPVLFFKNTEHIKVYETKQPYNKFKQTAPARMTDGQGNDVPEVNGNIREDSDVLTGNEYPEITLFDVTFNLQVPALNEDMSEDSGGENGMRDFRISQYDIGKDGYVYVTLIARRGFDRNDPNNQEEYYVKYGCIESKNIDVSEPKYIYNMGGSEFYQFYKKFLSEKKSYSKEDVYDQLMGRNRIGRYVLGDKREARNNLYGREYPPHGFGNHEYTEKDRIWINTMKEEMDNLSDEKLLQQRLEEVSKWIQYYVEFVKRQNNFLTGIKTKLNDRNIQGNNTDLNNFKKENKRKLDALYGLLRSNDPSNDPYTFAPMDIDFEEEEDVNMGDAELRERLRKRQKKTEALINATEQKIDNLRSIQYLMNQYLKIIGEETGGGGVGGGGRKPMDRDMEAIKNNLLTLLLKSGMRLKSMINMKVSDSYEGNFKSFGVYDHTAVFDENGRRRRENGDEMIRGNDMYDDNEFKSLPVQRTVWEKHAPIVRWDDARPEFWFQRYLARWLSNEDNVDFYDVDSFQAKYRSLFNNLRYENGKWIRDLTGLRLSKMIRGPVQKKNRAQTSDSTSTYAPKETTKVTRREAPRGGTFYSTTGETETEREFKDELKQEVDRTMTYEDEFLYRAEKTEGAQTGDRPCDIPCEVPLDFVEPLFNERFAHWKHDLVLGEYEKRSQYQADQWLQKTPWAIGKIYLMPSIMGHMMEAHVAIVTRFKKYSNVEMIDMLTSERHSFFFSKLVALCIRTSAILSGKKYGLDKMYMRLNLEKRRIMYSLGKLSIPSRRSWSERRPVEYTNVKRGKRKAYEEAMASGDRKRAQRILKSSY